MGDITFTFGQRGGYLFESASERRARLLPPKLTALFNEKKIKSVRSCALGSDDSFFVSYEGNDDLDHLHSNGLPASLGLWLYEKDSAGTYVRDFTKCRVVLGPNNASYFATDGAKYDYQGLPDGLTKALEGYRHPNGEWRTPPRVLALGADGNYIVINSLEGASWCLNHYRELDGYFDAFKEMENGISLVQDISLNPHRYNNFVLVGANGHVVSAGAPPHAEEGLADMTAVVKADTEKAVQQAKEVQRARQQQQQQLRQLQAETAAMQVQLDRLRRVQQLNAAVNAFNALSLGAMAGFWQPIS